MTCKSIKCGIIAVMLSLPQMLLAQSDTTQHVNSNYTNAQKQQQKPYVILISADGFRYDFAKKYQAEHLLALSATGVQAEAMIPSFPSLTFPNHYTLATGLYPSHHGLVNNTFYDRHKNDRYSMSAKDKVRDSSWYGGTPLWVLAEKQQMLAASLFWVGSEAAVQGTRPTYSYDFTEKIPLSNRIQIVMDWLKLPEARRPHLITFYISEPDHAAHTYGPESAQAAKAVKMVDSAVFALTEAVKTTGLPVNFVFVSDHGMTSVDQAHPLILPAAVDPEKFIVPALGTIVNVYAKNKADIKPLYKQLKEEAVDYKVYLKNKMPKQYHFREKDDRMNHIGDVILLPEWPKIFSKGKPGIGQHGFDPRKVKEMQATFFAWGPAFKSNMQIPAFENVNVYPLVAEILGLEQTEKVDGNIKVLKKVLK